MHFEVLVEDRSGGIALKHILEKILGPDNQDHTYEIRRYKGLGRIPANLGSAPDPRKKLLLDHLPTLLRAYGKSLAHVDAAVVVVVDLDYRDCRAFKEELLDVLESTDPAPTTLFRIAIEEGEAWLLGDRDALRQAYPRVKENVLRGYIQDSVCGTWEVLADAVYPGGSGKLKPQGYPVIGRAKCEWADRIAPLMDINANQSRSFQVFRDGVRRLAGIDR